ncbi:MAG TPA: hypothetical protein VK601_29360 [Kofleriaceae bacterium]|nr:hypothetical protein [Kofleriaceae bacterium]
MTQAAALEWTSRLGAVAAAVAALELLWVRRALADDGVFAWPVLRRELAPAPWIVRALADRALSYRGTLAVLGLQLAAALALPWSTSPLPAWLVLACSLAISIRFRGTYNGGSDAMLLVVMLALGIARSAPDTGGAAAGLAYVAAQLVLSYFIAGIAKLREATWRTGRALPLLVRTPHYRVPAWAAATLSRPAIARWAARSILAFECGFPLAFTHPAACTALLAAGAAFHLGNAIVFGLDRFLWTWLAAYPALIYWVDRATG